MKQCAISPAAEKRASARDGDRARRAALDASAAQRVGRARAGAAKQHAATLAAAEADRDAEVRTVAATNQSATDGTRPATTRTRTCNERTGAGGRRRTLGGT